MALPAVAVGVLVWGYRAYRTYEAYETAMLARETAELIQEMSQRREKIKKLLAGTLSSLRDEIDRKIGTLAAVDRGGRSTISRRGAEGKTWKEYIERKIPFRPAISLICQGALEFPIKVPRRIRRKVLGSEVTATIEVAMKQLTASLAFEAIDTTLDWKSPLKAEP